MISSDGRRIPWKPVAGIGCLALVAALIGQFPPNRSALEASSIPAQKAAMTENYQYSDIRPSNLFQPTPMQRGEIRQTEISGIAVSHQNNLFFWGIADSGRDSLLHLYAAGDAQLLATYHLENLKNDDWEEIQSLSDDTGKNYLILGEIGNNGEVKKNTQLLVMEEPPIKRSEKTIKLIPRVTTFSFQYPDSPKNCEAFIVDPITHALYVFTKELFETRVYYSDKFSLHENRSDTLQFIGALPLPMIVATDISSDGNEILLKSYHQIYYWKKESGASLRKTIFEAPQTLPYTPIEPQGESICWNNDNYLTLSEKDYAVLYEYLRR